MLCCLLTLILYVGRYDVVLSQLGYCCCCRGTCTSALELTMIGTRLVRPKLAHLELFFPENCSD